MQSSCLKGQRLFARTVVFARLTLSSYYIPDLLPSRYLWLLHSVAQNCLVFRWRMFFHYQCSHWLVCPSSLNIFNGNWNLVRIVSSLTGSFVIPVKDSLALLHKENICFEASFSLVIVDGILPSHSWPQCGTLLLSNLFEAKLLHSFPWNYCIRLVRQLTDRLQ